MTWGFEATNTSGQVLISSETRNLHFLGKANLYQTIRQFDGYGGLRHWAFRITANVVPVPFFTMPTDDYYAIAAVRQVDGATWDIEIIRSGTSSTIPEVYVFGDPRGVTARSTDYGMLVLRDDGTPSFDSRLNPLVVTGGISVESPSNPLTIPPPTLSGQYCDSGDAAASSMGPNNQNTYNLGLVGAKPIFNFSSIAQAEREFEYHNWEDACDGIGLYGVCIGFGRAYDWYSYYWAFYRGGIRYADGYLYAGWIAAQFGCHWSYYKKSSFIGIGTGSSSNADGKWPYTNETLNIMSTAVITADGSRYD